MVRASARCTGIDNHCITDALTAGNKRSFLYMIAFLNTFIFPLQFGHVLRDCISWSSQEGYQSTKRAASHGRLYLKLMSLFNLFHLFSILTRNHTLVTPEHHLSYNQNLDLCVMFFPGGP